jgi:hypothetical protein
MRQPTKIENIEEMRLREGIDDVELRKAIRILRTGDCVFLTIMNAGASGTGEKVSVKITHIGENGFRGKLASRPFSADLAELTVGSSVSFTRDHIHSIQKARPAPVQGHASC